MTFSSEAVYKKGMQRVVVIGCMGAGKSVFSARLGRLTGLKLHHLDRLFWRKGCEPGRREWYELQEKIVAEESWIIEGNYGSTIGLRLRRADTVIFLDYSSLSCFLGVLKRIVFSRLGLERRPDIVEGCNERTDLKFLRYAWDFNGKHRKGILSGLKKYPGVDTIILGDRKESEKFLGSLQAH